jgi:hypothetical protein
MIRVPRKAGLDPSAAMDVTIGNRARVVPSASHLDACQRVAARGVD